MGATRAPIRRRWWDALPLTLAGTYTIQSDTVLVYMLYTGFDEGEAAVEVCTAVRLG